MTAEAAHQLAAAIGPAFSPALGATRALIVSAALHAGASAEVVHRCQGLAHRRYATVDAVLDEVLADG